MFILDTDYKRINGSVEHKTPAKKIIDHSEDRDELSTNPFTIAKKNRRVNIDSDS